MQHFDGSRGPVCPLGNSPQAENDLAPACFCHPGSDHNLGKLQFGVWYDETLRSLSVKIIQAVDLPAMDINGSSDPYVRVVILPDKANKLLTKVRVLSSE